jgi:hypothetical protein
VSGPFYAKRFARAPQVTQQQLDELTQQIKQTESAIRSGLFGDEPFTTDARVSDWDWAVSSLERALFLGWTAQEHHDARRMRNEWPSTWTDDLPPSTYQRLANKIDSHGGASDTWGYLSRATLPSLKKRRAELKRQLRYKQSRLEGQR